MERLTIEYCGEYVPRELCSIDRMGGADDCDLCSEYCKATENGNEDCRDCAINKCFNKLAEYEDLEEQGKLLKLPCAVGDAVYEICDGFIEPCTVEVIYLADYKDEAGNSSYMIEIHYNREDCPWVSTEVYFTDIGKTVFLTKEEAEAALKELERSKGE